MQALPLATQTLFAELVERVTARDAARTVAQLAGSFATKTVAGQTYWYFKASQPGAGQVEYYLGGDSPALRDLAGRHRAGRADARAEDDAVAGLCAMLRSGGANVVDATAARVLRALADAGVFRLGGMLVGTYAYLVLGNVLGVRWQQGTRTQDLDIAAQPALALAVPPLATPAPAVLAGLDMGFLPVPGLDPTAPSTSFKVRGRELRVDFLTPARGARRTRPVPIPRLGVAATPLALLDYLLDAPLVTVAVNGGATAVTVPDPARFALHKLVLADRRPAAQQTKAAKDRQQATALLGWLAEERPGDLDQAVAAARAQYAPIATGLRRALRRLPAGEVRERIGAAVGSG
jgi:hypothetical protein